ncbi:uncharacterized protein LOC117591975 [Drosophila guanche]|uniref:Uncharacterized protein n=1 Tax=Drosophila guanche TaxID=7266 RepID=A0A3B0JKN5_DROGU|nr:uncharacterized protein LOC117591975 [Drosophila guanche]SPP73806.1 Hypothetical predicted protein [Drosophila guanche]
MCSVQIAFLWPLLPFLWLVALSSSAMTTTQKEALQQIPKLNLTQVQLIAGNASLRCGLIPELCDWQLHLYSGHPFSVPLSFGESTVSTPATITTTTTTTQSPKDVVVASTEEVFSLPSLLLVAQVEPKPRREKRRKRKLRRRRTFCLLSKKQFVWLFFQ